jgi:hypothetical protein
MRLWIQFAVAVLLATELGAQSTAAQTPVNPVIMQFVRFADIFGSRLVTAFDSIPEGQYAYRPSPTQQTIGFIAQHLEDANYGLCERFSEARRPRTARDSLADTIKARWPKDTLIVRLKASLTFCDNALVQVRELNSPELASTLLAFETDLAEHYAQLASYMRMLGLVPPSALPPRPRTAINLPAPALSQYVGAYEIALGWGFAIAMDGDALTIRSTLGGAPVRLWPETEAEFFVKEVDAQVTFTRVASGAVTGLVLHQYGRQRQAKKVR